MTNAQKTAIQHCKTQLDWANTILAKENILFASGKWSHDCAHDVIEQVNDKLLDLPVFTVDGTINLDV